MYVCVCMYACMDGWMDGWMDAWMDGCMHACMYVWSRVPCSRERELGGPYHWGGGQGSGVRTHIYIYRLRPESVIVTEWATHHQHLLGVCLIFGKIAEDGGPVRARVQLPNRKIAEFSSLW